MVDKKPDLKPEPEPIRPHPEHPIAPEKPDFGHKPTQLPSDDKRKDDLSPAVKEAQEAAVRKAAAAAMPTVPQAHTRSPKENAEKAACHAKIVEILKAHDQIESSIPLSSEYWPLLNQYRGM